MLGLMNKYKIKTKDVKKELTPKNYHYRKNYELLYERLCREAGVLVGDIYKSCSDYSLLLLINRLLIKLDLTPFTEEELEIDLV